MTITSAATVEQASKESDALIAALRRAYADECATCSWQLVRRGAHGGVAEWLMAHA